MNPIYPILSFLLTISAVHLGAQTKPSNLLFSGEPIVLTKGHQFAEGMAFDRDGNFYFTDVPASKLYRIHAKTGEKTLFDGETGKTNGIVFGPDGLLYGCAGGVNCIFQWDLKSKERKVIAKGIFSNDIAITEGGFLYFSDPKTRSVWSISPQPERKLTKVLALPWKPNGLALNPKKNTLFVAEFNSDKIHSFSIKNDGSVNSSKLAYLLATGENGRGMLDGMVILPSGKLLIGTAMGIQLAVPHVPQQGFIRPLVIPPFGNRPRCNYVRISPDGKWLYAAFKSDILRLPVRTGALD